jgi:hypothetical protein
MSEPTNTGWAGLIPHLLKAQIEVGAVAKASKNDFGNYKYASAEDMITASRNVLHKNGLIVTRNGWRIVNEVDTFAPLVEAVYVLAHCDGHNVACVTQYPICIGKGRPEDKALNASLTTGLSYFLRDLLLIPRCDEEVDQRPDTIARSGTRSTPLPVGGKKSRSAQNNRTKFMGSVAQWINRDISEDSTTEACVTVLRLLDLPTDGTATTKQFAEATKYVEDQLANNVDASGVLK